MKTLTNYKPHIEVTSDMQELAMLGFESFASHAKKAIKEKGQFNVAISGGFTPKTFLELLGTHPQCQDINWKKVHIFWVDERYVPKDSNSSNYHLADQAFLSKIKIPEKNIHSITTDYDNFEEAARKYEQEIKEVFNLEDESLPQFDLIFLGMGSDGHTGSLLPNSCASIETAHLATVVYVMDENLNRITLTYPVLRAASKLIVMISGAQKAEIVSQVFKSEPDEIKYPIHLLWPVLDKVTWIIDKDAARLL